MRKEENLKIITWEMIYHYADFLRQQEKSQATVEKYVHFTNY